MTKILISLALSVGLFQSGALADTLLPSGGQNPKAALVAGSYFGPSSRGTECRGPDSSSKTVREVVEQLEKASADDACLVGTIRGLPASFFEMSYIDYQALLKNLEDRERASPVFEAVWKRVPSAFLESLSAQTFMGLTWHNSVSMGSMEFAISNLPLGFWCRLGPADISFVWSMNQAGDDYIRDWLMSAWLKSYDGRSSFGCTDGGREAGNRT